MATAYLITGLVDFEVLQVGVAHTEAEEVTSWPADSDEVRPRTITSIVDPSPEPEPVAW